MNEKKSKFVSKKYSVSRKNSIEYDVIIDQSKVSHYNNKNINAINNIQVNSSIQNINKKNQLETSKNG